MQLRKELCDFVVKVSAVHLGAAIEWKLCPTKVQFASAVANFTDSRKLGGHPEGQLTEQQLHKSQ